ncbi:hypothetical protein ANDA3_0351 [plant metagenome]|uniref:DUF1840 domain-containing protein n=2 Tax=root TaxID=1 RepID=A0A1C3K1X6_9BURK|nr:DUF1840 domain-containing protein [Orrella dioscoreae]SBT25511.1 hypothetical protein ODI_04057 [Orrella dioscoreae]SOE46281.1 hypothetical protein ODI_R0224 [Orrella dioscoreae]
MLITFQSKAAGDVLMLEEHALPLLQAAGKAPGVSPERGVFTVAQLPAAIAGLEKAIAAAPPLADEDDDDDDDKPPVHPIALPVALGQRAFPLLDLLRKSQASGVDVMWEGSSAW